VALAAAVGGGLRVGAQEAKPGDIKHVEEAKPRAVKHVAEPQPPPDEITVDAESLSYDKKTDTISASGDVIIRRGESVLRADRVELNRQTNEAEVLGDSILTSPEVEIHADSMNLDLDDETGELKDAHIYSERYGYTLNGERIEKRIGQSYRIENGEFTTCHCKEGAQDWSIAGDSLDVTLDGYGYLEGGTFKIFDWPVLWIPRAAFDPESGSPAYCSRASASPTARLPAQPYYWAISKTRTRPSASTSRPRCASACSASTAIYSTRLDRRVRVQYFMRRPAANEIRAPGHRPEAPENRWDHRPPSAGLTASTRGYADLLLVSTTSSCAK
jgi:lipopolysaccharide export system protein LptA